MANPEHLIADYCAAFKAGDLATTAEILQFAKHDAVLSEQLLALEAELLVDAPPLDVDVEPWVATIHRGGHLHRLRDNLESWIGDHAAEIRALIRFWPFGAALGFGLALYGLGTGPEPPLSWWLGLAAALCIGSIAVVCTSSLWRRYPTQNQGAMVGRAPAPRPLRDERNVEPKQTFGGRILVRRHRTVTTATWGFAVAASLIIVIMITLQTSPFRGHSPGGDIERWLSTQYLLIQGEIADSQSFFVPLRFNSDNIPMQPFLLAAKLASDHDDRPIPWALTIIDNEGNLVSASRGENGAALVSLPNFPSTDQEWLAMIHVMDPKYFGEQLPVSWSLYSNGAKNSIVAAARPIKSGSDDRLKRIATALEGWQMPYTLPLPTTDPNASPTDEEPEPHDP